MVTLTASQPRARVIETALKLRKQYGTMIYAIGIENSFVSDMTDLTGAADRVIWAKKEQDLPLLITDLRTKICAEISSCSTIRFQCLKRYNYAEFPSSVITNCQRTKCQNFNCLTRPCRTTETCLAKNEYDHICIEGAVKSTKVISLCSKVNCQHGMCKSTSTSFDCHCYPGWTKAADGICSKDIDECRSKSVCAHKCENTVGSYKCSCNAGYKLADNGRTCVDVDECLTDQNQSRISIFCTKI